MAKEVIEGPWETVAQRAPELAGKWVRVEVLDAAPKSLAERMMPALEEAWAAVEVLDAAPKSLAERLTPLLEPAWAITDSLPKRAEVGPETWEEGLVEKYRKQGLNL